MQSIGPGFFPRCLCGESALRLFHPMDARRCFPSLILSSLFSFCACLFQCVFGGMLASVYFVLVLLGTKFIVQAGVSSLRGVFSFVLFIAVLTLCFYCFNFTPLQCQLVKFCVCAEFLDTKLSGKPNFEIPIGVPTEARVTSNICNHTFYALIFLISCNFFKVFEAKKSTRSFG